MADTRKASHFESMVLYGEKKEHLLLSILIDNNSNCNNCSNIIKKEPTVLVNI